jgi:ADP-ribose pyrophosphatase
VSDGAAPEIVWQGRYITTIREGRWEYVNRARGIGAAVIIAIDDAPDGRHVLLVEQYRVPLHRNCIELPAGLIGDEGDDEPSSVAAERELAEETGYAASDWQDLGQFYSSPGMVGEYFTLMLARGLSKVGPGGGVAGEDIIVHRVPMAGIADFIAAKRAKGCAVDGKVTMLLVGGWLGRP